MSKSEYLICRKNKFFVWVFAGIKLLVYFFLLHLHFVASWSKCVDPMHTGPALVKKYLCSDFCLKSGDMQTNFLGLVWPFYGNFKNKIKKNIKSKFHGCKTFRYFSYIFLKPWNYHISVNFWVKFFCLPIVGILLKSYRQQQEHPKEKTHIWQKNVRRRYFTSKFRQYNNNTKDGCLIINYISWYKKGEE